MLRKIISWMKDLEGGSTCRDLGVSQGLIEIALVQQPSLLFPHCLKKLLGLGSFREVLAGGERLLKRLFGQSFIAGFVIGKREVIENRRILAFEFFVALF